MGNSLNQATQNVKCLATAPWLATDTEGRKPALRPVCGSVGARQGYPPFRRRVAAP